MPDHKQGKAYLSVLDALATIRLLPRYEELKIRDQKTQDEVNLNILHGQPIYRSHMCVLTNVKICGSSKGKLATSLNISSISNRL